MEKARFIELLNSELLAAVSEDKEYFKELLVCALGYVSDGALFKEIVDKSQNCNFGIERLSRGCLRTMFLVSELVEQVSQTRKSEGKWESTRTLCEALTSIECDIREKRERGELPDGF